MRQRAGERDELLLAGGESRAALADFFLESLGKSADEVGQVHVFGGLFDVFVGNPVRAQANVAFDRSGKQKRILQDHAEAAAEFGEVHFFYVDAVDFDRALLHVVEAHQQRDDRGLAGAGVADDGDRLTGFDGEGNVAENPVGFGRNRSRALLGLDGSETRPHRLRPVPAWLCGAGDSPAFLPASTGVSR